MRLACGPLRSPLRSAFPVLRADFCFLRVNQYITSPAGKELSQKLWNETMAEMAKLTTIPAELTANAYSGAPAVFGKNDAKE